MLKFLRKYNKWILVIGGSLLMVAFLAPQAIQQMPKLRDRTVATYDGKPVKESKLMHAAAELRAVNALGGQVPLANFMLGLSAPTNEQDIEWYMLAREAEEAGYVGSDLDGVTLYPLLAQQLALLQADFVIQQNPGLESLRAQLANSYVETWTQRLQASEAGAASAGQFRTLEELRQAVAKLRGVLRMRSAYSTMGRLSASRATRTGSETFDAAQVDYVAIPADRFTDTLPEPTEDEIAAHYAKYAEAIPGETEFGIGYRQPQRVKLEWLALERTPIEDAITIDPVEASKHQQLNKDRFPGSYSEERPNIIAELKREKAEQILGQAENFVRAEMLRATRTLKRENGYLVLPEDWSQVQPSLESIAAHVVQQVAEANQGLTIPPPTITRRDSEWLTQQEVFSLPGFGFSQLRVGSAQFPAVAAVFSVRELNPNPNLALQVNVLASDHPTTGNDGTRYFFRVLDARKESAPESLEEVRADVVRDIKRIQAYQGLVEELSSYTEVAINAGLEEVVEAVNAGLPAEGEATVGEDTPARVSIIEGVVLRSRVGQGTPPVFTDEDVLSAALEVAEPLDPTMKIEDIPLPDRTFAAPAPKALSVVVGRVSGLLPLTQEDFALGYNQLSSVLTQLEVEALGEVDNPYTFERLKARHNWVNKDKRRQATVDDAVE